MWTLLPNDRANSIISCTLASIDQYPIHIYHVMQLNLGCLTCIKGLKWLYVASIYNKSCIRNTRATKHHRRSCTRILLRLCKYVIMPYYRGLYVLEALR